MNKFYSYLSPIAFFIIIHALAIMLFNNEPIAYFGLLISSIWLHRVASKFDNKVVKILSIVIFSIAILWGCLILMLLVASSFRNW